MKNIIERIKNHRTTICGFVLMAFGGVLYLHGNISWLELTGFLPFATGLFLAKDN